ncbi:MAG: hypothetical protein M0R37_12780 [Bacteroidales bacterium]|nr:hypothetical protein [Bacteroidales bacterium]
MRTTALVLGIVGGVFGIIAGLIAMAVGGVGVAAEADGGGMVTVLGLVAVMLAVAGIVGGALAHRSPRACALLELIAGVGGFIAVSAFWLLSGPLFIVGAIMAFASRKRKAQTVVA